MAARKRQSTPRQKPPKAVPWAHAYNRKLQAYHQAFSEHAVDFCKKVLGGPVRTDAYDPEEPRDEHGEWAPAGAGKSPRLIRAQTRLRQAQAAHAAGPTDKTAKAVAFHTREVARVTPRPGKALGKKQRYKPLQFVGGEITPLQQLHSSVLAKLGTLKSELAKIDPKYTAARAHHGRLIAGQEKRLARVVKRRGIRTDAIGDDLRDLFGPLIEALGLNKFLRRMGNSITKAQANYLKRVANVPVSGVAPAAKLEAWRQQNLALIKSLTDEQIQVVGDILRPAQAQGLRWEDIADEIQGRLDVGASRAKLIARDQTNKWNGAMQQQTQDDAGITSYRWSTARDNAVRGRPDGVYAKSKENHWDLEGTVHRWDSPPTIPGTNVQSHPGGRIQCRCVAVPVVPWLDGT